MKKKTSLKDIARLVGVSTALVSYVLNNKKEGRIGKEVSEKIRRTAAKLNYIPNQIARSLKTNQSLTIGLIVADISNPFSSSLARIVEDEAHRHGYTVIFGSSDERAAKSERLLVTLLNRQVDGLIISPPEGSEEQVKNLIKQQVPLVLLDRYFPGIETNHVSVDNYAAAYEATEHLIAVGRRMIGMIAYKSQLHNLEQRVAGYRAALKKAKLPFDKNWLQYVDIGNDSAEISQAARQLLEQSVPVDAILFGSNRIAAGALKCINTMPVNVPRDLSLIGFDETEIFDFFHAPLTFVQQPVVEMGKLATKILLENIEKKQKLQQVLMPATLVVRKSTSVL